MLIGSLLAWSNGTAEVFEWHKHLFSLIKDLTSSLKLFHELDLFSFEPLASLLKYAQVEQGLLQITSASRQESFEFLKVKLFFFGVINLALDITLVLAGFISFFQVTYLHFLSHKLTIQIHDSRLVWLTLSN